jgi:DNA-binding MarR family transcriptional regulator/N-acetylglutamate synthase-like GNAT family acetyltransferase
MDSRQVRQVRRFNRLVTQRVGALDDSYLCRGRPLGEARLIFEAGADGADVRTLRAKLGLDSGYLSRLLRSLEQQRLVSVGKQAKDGRMRRVVLTRRGRAELARYEALSDGLAASMLAPLDPGQRERLVNAMAEVEQLLAAAAIEVRVEPADSANVRWCLAEYFRDLAQRFDAGFDPARSNPATVEDMTPPSGYFVLARVDGVVAGCGALKRLDAATAEIKRMWTVPEMRGRGVAGRVLQALEAIAREAGVKTLRLETNRTLTEAQALYRRQGYDEVSAFNAEPYAHHWFEKRL